MEENFWENIQALPPAQEAQLAPQYCCTDSAPSESVESGVTVESARSESCRDADAAPDESTVWTNQMHNSYLDYLETSFVEQLNHSISIRGWLEEGKIWGPFSFHEQSVDCRDSVGRINLHDCAHKKTSLTDRAAPPAQRNQWINHFKSSRTRRPIRSAIENFLEDIEPMRKPEMRTEYQSCREDSIGGAAEASAQNFVDETEEDKPGCAHSPKTPRSIASHDDSVSDQVVPLRKLEESGISSVVQNFPESEEQGLPAKRPRNLNCRRADLHHFQGGS